MQSESIWRNSTFPSFQAGHWNARIKMTLNPGSWHSTGKQICVGHQPWKWISSHLGRFPPGTLEAISLLQVLDRSETLQTRISRAAFAVEWRHVKILCEDTWRQVKCEDMKVLARICSRKQKLPCLSHESRQNRSSDHNFRREFLRWWYWLTASWRHPLRVQGGKVVWFLAHTDYMHMDGTQLLSLRESEDAEAEQETYRRDSRPHVICPCLIIQSLSTVILCITLHDKIRQVLAISMIHCARASSTPNTSAVPTESATHELPSQPSSCIGAWQEKWSEENGSNKKNPRSDII